MVGLRSPDFLIYAFQARVGKGKLLATGLDLLSGAPEAEYLLEQFIKYAGSERFRPTDEFPIKNNEK